jgi:putative hydrolase of the HAD superfamily
VRALKRLGLQDCFEDIICFESLNKPCPLQPWDMAGTEIFDIAGHLALSGGRIGKLPKTPVLCKPSIDAMQEALRIFDVNPSTAVRFRLFGAINFVPGRVLLTKPCLHACVLQVFFDDSVRNIQAGKQIGLRTVLVRQAYPAYLNL